MRIALQRREAYSSSDRYRGATCQLRPPTNSRLRLESACARHSAACLSREGEARGITARARRPPLAELGPRTTKVHCSGRRPLSFLARPWCDMPAAASNPQSPFAWHARERHFAACPSVGGVARELAARARRKALVVIGPRTIEGHCAGERPLSFIARPWCDVLDVAFNSQSAFAWHAREHHYAGCLSGGGAVRVVAVRAPCRAVCGRITHRKRALHRRKNSLSSVQVHGAMCQLRPPTHRLLSCGTRASGTALPVSREEAQHAS